MKTKTDLLGLLTKRESMNIKQKFKWSGFKNTNFIYNNAFIVSMSKYPNLINDYKHLVDVDTIKECLNINPLIKLYLED